MTEGNTTRRRVLKIVVGGVTVAILIPSKWIKPIMEIGRRTGPRPSVACKNPAQSVSSWSCSFSFSSSSVMTAV